MSEPTTGPLQEASTQELIEELFRRTNACLVVWERDCADANENASVVKHSYHGGTYRILGMIEITKAVMVAGQVFNEESLYRAEDDE